MSRWLRGVGIGGMDVSRGVWLRAEQRLCRLFGVSEAAKAKTNVSRRNETHTICFLFPRKEARPHLERCQPFKKKGTLSFLQFRCNAYGVCKGQESAEAM